LVYKIQKNPLPGFHVIGTQINKLRVWVLGLEVIKVGAGPRIVAN
jgi:hypothetical protein